MIVLHTFGPMFGLPDPSGFVMKTETQLQMAGLAYCTETGGFAGAPKGKLPYIVDGGKTVADSTFIREHIEKTRRIDLDRGLTAEMRARGWAIERLLEDHLYWSILHLRWADDANFARGPAQFFGDAPDTVKQEGRALMLQTLHAHGLGRHAPDEIDALGRRSVSALAALLGHKPYLFGPEPSGADATAFAMIASLLAPFFQSSLRDFAAGHANLVAYSERMMAQYFPAFAEKKAA